MDIVVPKKDLQKLLERCHGVADKKSAVPALANVLLTAEGRTIRVAATDLYLGMSGECEAEVATRGAIAIPAKDTFERVKAMPEGPVQITVTEGARATIKAVGQPRRYTLPGLPGNDFPLLPKAGPDAPALELPVDVLALLMERTHFSISLDETRAHVNSALFEWSGDLVRMVSTDGHRLSKMESRVPGASATTSMLIPLKAIGELRRLVDAARAAKATVVQIRQAGPNAFFDVAGIQFSVRLIDAQFPPYESVLPAAPPFEVRAPRLKLVDAIKALQVAASEKTGGVKFTFTGGALRLTTESPEHGAGFDQVDIDYAGKEVTIGLNAKYVLDVLTAFDDDDAVLAFASELDPMVVKPGADTPGDSYIGVIMPCRL